MGKLIGIFDTLSDFIDKHIISYFVFLLLAGMVVVTTAQIVFRVFFTALSWSEELTRYLLVWGTFFAATMAYKRGSHIAITFITNLFPKKIKFFLVLLMYLLSLTFFVVVISYAVGMMKIQGTQISPALSLPMKYVYSAIPMSMAIMIVHGISKLSNEVREYLGKDVAA